MLTPSVNVVQSAFPEERQGEISGLSRSVSNLGSSFGTAIAGTILVSGLTTPTRSYALAMIVVGAIGFVGLAATAFLRNPDPAQLAGAQHRRPAGTADRTASAKMDFRRSAFDQAHLLFGVVVAAAGVSMSSR